MILVKSHKTRNTQTFHAYLLNAGNIVFPLLHGRGYGVRRIKNRAYFIVADDGICFVLIDMENTILVVAAKEVGDELNHLACLLLKSHLRKKEVDL